MNSHAASCVYHGRFISTANQPCPLCKLNDIWWEMYPPYESDNEDGGDNNPVNSDSENNQGGSDNEDVDDEDDKEIEEMWSDLYEDTITSGNYHS